MALTVTNQLGVADLLGKRAIERQDALALTDGRVAFTYAELDRRVHVLASALRAVGMAPGDRIAVLSENRIEYIELELAAAVLGATVACLNWRLSDEELRHCIRLVSPVLAVVSPRYAETLTRIDHGAPRVVTLGPEFEALRAKGRVDAATDAVDPEAGLVILYTSGTTGLPKGALVSQRAMVARAMVFAADFGIDGRHSFLAWSPLFHMAATDHALATLMLGGKVIVHDGLDVPRICDLLSTESMGWLVAMPGMIEQLIEGLKAHRGPIIPPVMVGAMADLVPRHQIAELTRLIGAPYLNSFGSTETGIPPASAVLLPPGEVPESLSKRESGMCRIRLVDREDRDVPLETPGELIIRGPTLFSGYWNAAETNARDFRGGWFHLGDMFVRHADGSLDFVDRVKYMIKSGGENIYPAEIERVLLADPRIADAAVVRKRDARWGEIPVAFVARNDESLTAADVEALCRGQLAGYKRPREIHFLRMEDLPRSTSGKILRERLEELLEEGS